MSSVQVQAVKLSLSKKLPVAATEDTPRVVVGVNPDGSRFSRAFPNESTMIQFLLSLAPSAEITSVG